MSYIFAKHVTAQRRVSTKSYIFVWQINIEWLLRIAEAKQQ